MHAALAVAVAIALVTGGPAFGGEAPEAVAGGFAETDRSMQVAQATERSGSTSAPRANVPRTGGTGLAGVPAGGGGTVMGLSPGAAALLGIVIVGGIIAIVGQDDDDEPAPAGTGTGGS